MWLGFYHTKQFEVQIIYRGNNMIRVLKFQSISKHIIKY